MSWSGTARWSCHHKSSLVVADTNGAVLATFEVSPNGDRPGPQMLWDTGWCGYPGSEWEEEPPGEWSLAVFNHGLMRKGSDRDD